MKTSRLANRNRDDIEYHKYNTIPDLVHDQMKSIFRTSDDEYDFLCKYATEEEMNVLALEENVTFATKRKVISIINKYLTHYHNGDKLVEPPDFTSANHHTVHFDHVPDEMKEFFADMKKIQRKDASMDEISAVLKKYNPDGIVPEGLKHIPVKPE